MRSIHRSTAFECLAEISELSLFTIRSAALVGLSGWRVQKDNRIPRHNRPAAFPLKDMGSGAAPAKDPTRSPVSSGIWRLVLGNACVGAPHRPWSSRKSSHSVAQVISTSALMRNVPTSTGTCAPILVCMGISAAAAQAHLAGLPSCRTSALS